MAKIMWNYADKFGELSSPHAEIVEALVVIAEELNELNERLTKGITSRRDEP